MNRTVINKYDKVISLPPTHDTAIEKTVEDILLDLGVPYAKQFFFDETGLRKTKYDFAILKDSKPVLFIECDGEPHYDPVFYMSVGNRPERNMAHVTKAILADAYKTKLAVQKRIPLLRVTKIYEKCVRELIMSYISVIVDNNTCDVAEIRMLNMFEKYGFTFPYIPPAEPSKKVAEHLHSINII